MLNFESSSGSSWLIQELAGHPLICVVLFEPIDNISLSSAADHMARLRWLDLLWSPPATADEAAWHQWRAGVERASLFGQLPLVRSSLQRCTHRSVAFGLKARLTRLLTHDSAMDGLVQLMARHGVRFIRLTRQNRVKQALAEYRRLHAGLGQFRAAASDAVAASSVSVRVPLFRACLRAVERSHRLAVKVLGRLPSEQPQLELCYEDLRAQHTRSLSHIAHFLGVDSQPLSVEPSGRSLVKSTPDRLCEAVANYAKLCNELSRHDPALVSFLEDPCDTKCLASTTHRRLPSVSDRIPQHPT